MTDTLLPIKDFLVSEGLVRNPDSPGPKPPIVIHPEDGVAGPTQEEPMQVGMFRATGIPPRSFQGFIRIDGVEFIVFARDAKDAVEFEAVVRASLNDRRDWYAGPLHVHESRLTRDLQPVGSGPQGYLFNFEYQIERWS